jgi:hypothetical protein
MLQTIANLPNWFIYASVGTLLGLIGASLSWLAEGVGQKWTRLLPIVAIALTGPVTRELVMPSVQNARFESGLTRSRWMETMQAEMPDEYERVVAAFQAIRDTSASRALAEKMSSEFMADFRKRHAQNLARAGDELLTKYLRDYLALVKAVRDNDGTRQCAEFANKGAWVLRENLTTYEDTLDQSVALLVHSVASSLRNPQLVDPATDKDWEVVVTKFLEAGGTEAELQVVEAQDASSPSYCQGIIGFFQAIIATPPPSGHRIRAEMAKGMAEG